MPPMNVLVTGASGLIGSALVRSLAEAGHGVVKLSRVSAAGARPPGPSGPSATWDPSAGQIDLSRAGPLDAVIHLAGETVGRRWTAPRKQRIRQSRVAGTRLLSEAIVRLPQLPQVMLCASATGFYGDGGDRWFDESSGPGAGFLAEVTREWEAAATPAVQRGLRVVHCRFGLVLSLGGGALGRMLPLFKVGLGGRLGGGRQYWSWITLEDVLSFLHLALRCQALSGAINVVTPNPVTNAEFTKVLAGSIHRPAVFSVPQFAVELFFGEMGREALLASCRVKPAKLLENGFPFRWAELDRALGHLFGRTRGGS